MIENCVLEEIYLNKTAIFLGTFIEIEMIDRYITYRVIL